MVLIGEEGKEELAEAAFWAFMFRFSAEVTKKSEIIWKNWGESKEFAEEVVETTFKRFLKYTGFDYSKSKIKDVDKAVLVYLFRISRNVLTDLWNAKYGTKQNPYDGSEEIVWDYPTDKDDCGAIENPRSHKAIVKKALSALSEKHKVIFLTYAKYQDKDFKLPRKLLAELRENLGISQQTIRSYKNEAQNKIKEYLEIYEYE